MYSQSQITKSILSGTIVAIVLFIFTQVNAQQHLPVPKQERISEISDMLPDEPRGLGVPVQYREVWNQMANSEKAEGIISQAEKYMEQLTPQVTRELWKSFLKGEISRQVYSKRFRKQGQRFGTFVLAEVFENEGRFIDPIEKELKAMLAVNTWTHPTHASNHNMDYWEGRKKFVDLYAARRAFTISTADYWLGDRLDSDLRQDLRDYLKKEIFQPYLEQLNTSEEEWWWMTGTMNWNSVCTAGVIGTALTMIEDPEKRATFIAGGELSAPYYIKGFPSDGLCLENLGYWSYGFSRYLLLNEIIRINTDNTIDWLKGEKVSRIILYPERSEIINELYPSFSDEHIYGQPGEWISDYAKLRIGMGGEISPAYLAKLKLNDFIGQLHLLGMLLIEYLPATKPDKSLFPDDYHSNIRDYFPDGGLLVVRPLRRNSRGMGVSIKGGHNGAPHNHNDVGTFEIVKASEKLVIDPGSEVYGQKTFSEVRYESEIMNSFGHCVPVVADSLQSSGEEARAEVIEKKFTKSRDFIKFDLSKAYDVDILKKLTRSFEYTRGEDSELIVRDKVVYSEPASFGTGITVDTYIRSIKNRLSAEWEQTGKNQWKIEKGDEAIKIEVSTNKNHELEFTTKSLEGFRIPEGYNPLRLGFNLNEPVTSGVIEMKITPVPRE